MSDKPTINFKLFRSSLVLSVGTAGTKGITASIFKQNPTSQTVFSTADVEQCRIKLFDKGDQSDFWVGSTCFAITRCTGEKLAKTFDIQIAEGAAA